MAVVGTDVSEDRMAFIIRVFSSYLEFRTMDKIQQASDGRMTSSGMFRSTDLVRTDVSEERISIIMVTKIGELGTRLTATSNRNTLRNLLRLLVTAEVPSSLVGSDKSHTA
jgi:hypothetical protein